MLKLKAEAFLRVHISIGQIIGLVSGWESTNSDKVGKVLTDTNAKSTDGFLNELISQLDTLGAPFSKVEAQRLLAEVNDKPRKITFLKVKQILEGLKLRIRDEFSLIGIYILDPTRKKYFEFDAPPFGPEVADKLPLAIPDIEDAGKCLALNMGTASVFHSMRVMEAGLKCLAKMLDVPYAPSWESYISQIEAKITAKHKTKGVKWKRDEAFYREMLGNLQTIKIAWRNPTMHIVRRYSVDEGEEIYIAVRGFLRRLEPRLPKPKPKKAAS